MVLRWCVEHPITITIYHNALSLQFFTIPNHYNFPTRKTPQRGFPHTHNHTDKMKDKCECLCRSRMRDLCRAVQCGYVGNEYEHDMLDLVDWEIHPDDPPTMWYWCLLSTRISKRTAILLFDRYQQCKCCPRHQSNRPDSIASHPTPLPIPHTGCQHAVL